MNGGDDVASDCEPIDNSRLSVVWALFWAGQGRNERGGWSEEMQVRGHDGHYIKT